MVAHGALCVYLYGVPLPPILLFRVERAMHIFIFLLLGCNGMRVHCCFPDDNNDG